MSALVRYDAMCLAIAQAHAIDEVKEIHDQALAMTLYARQAKNTDAEQKACEIRLRAERRAGQLLAEMPKAKGAAAPGTNRGATPSHDASASKPLAEIGISHTQSSRWQKLAAIPDADCWRAAKALGWRRLITYTLQSESGASLRGAGYSLIAERPANDPAGWQSRPGRGWQPVVGQSKFLWERAA